MAKTTDPEVEEQVDIDIGDFTHTVDQRVADYITALEGDFEKMKAHALDLEAQVAKDWKAEILKFKSFLQNSASTREELFDRLLKHLGL